MARGRSSPRLSLLLGAVFLLAAKVFAASAVLGVDLGTEYIKAALVKPGIPLEIVLTKDSRRKEASAVAFKPPHNGPRPGAYPERLYGSDAMALAPRFPGDVYPNLKVLLGLPADHPTVEDYARRNPALQLERHEPRNTAAFKSRDAFAPEELPWMVEELLAMQLQSVQKNAEALAGPGTTVRSVVLTVPPFYTTEEKRAVELAADLAGLKVLSLVSDGLAVGLNYATSRQFPNVNEGARPEHHMVFDMGAGSTKATVLKMQSRTVKDVGKFNKTVQELVVLGSGWDRSLGGDALNTIIVDDMVQKFVDTPAAKRVSASAEDVKAHGRAVAKLSKEAERLRHVLSANTNTQASFEGLYEDVDFRYKITRAEFEALCAAHADRVGVAVQNALDVAGLRVEDLQSVILHGGATRTPFVQRQLEKIFGGGDKLRSNVNSDEAAVFGAGFRAAELSPSFRVKEIRISEGAAYAVEMKYANDRQKVQHQRLWSATSYLGAPAKEVAFANKEDFAVDFFQQIPVASGGATPKVEEIPIKAFGTKNLTATVAAMAERYACEPGAVQFKVGFRLASEDGEVEVTKAYVECETEVAEKESFVDGVKNMLGLGNKKDQQPLGDATDASESPESDSTTLEPPASSAGEASSATASTSAASTAASEPAKKTKKSVTLPVQYELQKAGAPGLDQAGIVTLKDRLRSFEASDRSRRLREEALNQLEGFTYKIRDLLDSEAFVAASTGSERASLESKSSAASDWLYGDGAEASKEELKARLKELRDIVAPIQARIDERSQRPALIRGLKDALNQTTTFVASIKGQIAEAEAWASAKAASATAASSPSPDATTSTSSGDAFAGLEDDDGGTAATTQTLNTEGTVKERGPVPPLYTLDDLRESEELYQSISAWLREKEAEQETLPPTADPVLSVKELTEKREKLDKVGMDLAMKGVRNFESKQKKAKSSGSAGRTRKSKSTEAAEGSTTEPTAAARPGEGEAKDGTGEPRHDEL